MNFEWFTYQWFLDNFFWIIGFLLLSMCILFLFPILLSYDLYKKDKEINNNDKK